MGEKEEKAQYKKFLLLLIGGFVLVLGISLVLRWWPEVIIFVKGVAGMVLAIGGLLMLYGLNKK